jgi:hypothetical protein
MDRARHHGSEPGAADRLQGGLVPGDDGVAAHRRSFTGRPDQIAVLGRTGQLQEYPTPILRLLPPSVARDAKLTKLTHGIDNRDAFSSGIGAGARRSRGKSSLGGLVRAGAKWVGRAGFPTCAGGAVHPAQATLACGQHPPGCRLVIGAGGAPARRHVLPHNPDPVQGPAPATSSLLGGWRHEPTRDESVPVDRRCRRRVSVAVVSAIGAGSSPDRRYLEAGREQP